MGLCMELCWQQLPEASFLTFLLSTCQLPPVGLVGRVSSGPQDCAWYQCSHRLGGQGCHETAQYYISWVPFLIILCPVSHRSLLRKLGGLFLPIETLSLDSSEGVLTRAVVHAVSALVLVYGTRLRVQGAMSALTLISDTPSHSRLWNSC